MLCVYPSVLRVLCICTSVSLRGPNNYDVIIAQPLSIISPKKDNVMCCIPCMLYSSVQDTGWYVRTCGEVITAEEETHYCSRGGRRSYSAETDIFKNIYKVSRISITFIPFFLSGFNVVVEGYPEVGNIESWRRPLYICLWNLD